MSASVKTTYRQAVVDDIDALLIMGLEFHAESHYAKLINVSEDSIRDFLMLLVGNPHALTLIAEDEDHVVGMLVAATFIHPLSGDRIGHEVCWWMAPEARGGRTPLRMLRAAEEWATQQGAKYFHMVAPTYNVAHFYERLGYDRLEVHYQRSL